MASNHRIFVSFAIEDIRYRDLLVGQARHDRSPFSFVDMSVKEPWDSMWKTNCRSKIRGCDGVIALVSKNTAKGTGALWEISCAKEETVPVRGIYIQSDDKPSILPTELSGVRVVDWTWSGIKSFLDSL
jgi:hypothetical protein